MAGGTEVTFTGIRDISKLVKTGGDNALLKLAITGTSYAKLFADFEKGYQTGQTRNSIQYKVYNGKKGGQNDSQGIVSDSELNENLKENEAIIGATTNHAPYVEFGTRKMAPQPYLRPSLAKIAGDTAKVVQEKVNAEIKNWEIKYGKQKVKL